MTSAGNSVAFRFVVGTQGHLTGRGRILTFDEALCKTLEEEAAANPALAALRELTPKLNELRAKAVEWEKERSGLHASISRLRSAEPSAAEALAEALDKEKGAEMTEHAVFNARTLTAALQPPLWPSSVPSAMSIRRSYFLSTH